MGYHNTRTHTNNRERERKVEGEREREKKRGSRLERVANYSDMREVGEGRGGKMSEKKKGLSRGGKRERRVRESKKGKSLTRMQWR